MSVAVSSGSGSTSTMHLARTPKSGLVRRGPAVPLLLDAFPAPPNHTTIKSSPSSPHSPFPSSKLQLPSIGSPPTTPLPDLPRSPLSSTLKPTSKTEHAKEMSRSISPDLSTIISASSRKTRSRRADSATGSVVERKRGGHVGGSGDRGGDSGNESGGSESSLDIHTPLPNLMVREGLISPTSKALNSRSTSPTPSYNSLASTNTFATTNLAERERRKVRHRNNKVLKEGLGLTTGLGWSDSEDEDEGGMGLMKRVSSNASLQSTMRYPSPVKSAPPTSAMFIDGLPYTPSSLSRSITSSSIQPNSTPTTAPSPVTSTKPTRSLPRSMSDNTVRQRGNSEPQSAQSDSSSGQSLSSQSSRKPKSSRLAPARPRLPSIGETEKAAATTRMDEFGALQSEEMPAELYGRSGFNYSMPRLSKRHSGLSSSSIRSGSSTSSLPYVNGRRPSISPASSTDSHGHLPSISSTASSPTNFAPPGLPKPSSSGIAKSSSSARAAKPTPKPTITSTLLPAPNPATAGASTPTTPTPAAARLATPKAPQFRKGMDVHIERFEEMMRRDLESFESKQVKPKASTESGLTTPRDDERSRTPTPQSPGDSFSTTSSHSMPITPRNEENLMRARTTSEASMTSVSSASSVSSGSRMVTPTALKSALKKPRELDMNATPRAAPPPLARTPTATSTLSNTPSRLALPTSRPSLIASIPPSSSTRKTPPPRPPPSQMYIPPGSVTYAENMTTLHPLSRARATYQQSSAPPQRTSSLHPLNQPLNASYLPQHLSGKISPLPISGSGGVGAGGMPRLGLGKLVPKKSTVTVKAASIGAGGVTRI